MASFRKSLDSFLNNSLGSPYVTLQVTPRYPLGILKFKKFVSNLHNNPLISPKVTPKIITT